MAVSTLGTGDNLFKKGLYSGDDLDNICNVDDAGFYYVDASVTNSPINYAGLIVITVGGVTFQLIFNQSHLHFRVRTGNPLAWKAWKEVALASS